MAIKTPDLSQLNTRIQQDFVERLPDSDVRLPFSFANILSKALAGLVFGLYQQFSYVAKQWFPHLCEEENIINHATLWGVPRLEGTYATGTLSATGTNGTVIPEGSIWQRSDGIQYKSTAVATISAGVVTVSIQSLEVGVKANGNSGSSFSLVSPILGINATATSSALIGASDVESLVNWRTRVLRRIQYPPGVGTVNDYETWTKSVPNVTRAWCTPLISGAGTVGVHFMMDGSYSNGIPLVGDQTVVLNTLNGLRPVTASLSVVIPTAQPINFTIDLNPDSSQIRQNVEASLKAIIQQYSAPGKTFPISKLREAISIAQGEGDHTLTSPTANISASSANHIHTLGTITWT
jgi:uncharacterized phage protein gp47/JayE